MFVFIANKTIYIIFIFLHNVTKNLNFVFENNSSFFKAIKCAYE